jgi:MraZ protein
MNLTGKYEHTMDPKGRIILPTEFRDAFLVNDVAEVHLLSVNDRIQLLPQQTLKELISELKSHSSLDMDTMDLRSLLYSSIKKAEIKPDGRISIPPLFREDAGLKKKVYIIGADDRVEIWDVDLWTKRFEKGGKKLGELFQKVHDQRYRKDVNLRQKD